jgi:hypothetical protein
VIAGSFVMPLRRWRSQTFCNFSSRGELLAIRNWLRVRVSLK